jgi:endonuclease G
MKRITLSLFFILSLSLLAFTQNNPLDFGNPDNAVDDSNTSPDKLLVVHSTFTMSYNKSRGAANWVAWHLDTDILGNLTRPKPDPFAPDTLLPTDFRIVHADYTGSGFDRGHMCPSGDRTKVKAEQVETFVMSNMQAQTGNLNRKTWKSLEDHERGIALAGQEEYIYAGCYGGTKKIKGKIVVPTKCFKIILILPKGDDDLSRVTPKSKIIAVIMPNIKDLPAFWSNPAFLTTIDKIEKETGLDFFSNLPEDVEKIIEARQSLMLKM